MLPKRDHSITFDEAAEFIDRYQKAETAEPQEFQFHNDQVQDLTAQADAAIFCVSPGLDKNGKPCVVLGVRDKEGKEVGPIKLELSLPYP